MTAAPAPTADSNAPDGAIDLRALLGVLSVEAGLVTQDLVQLQTRLGDMLGQGSLSDKNIADLQGLDQLTQRVADLAAILDAAGASLPQVPAVPLEPLLHVAKLEHSRRLLIGIDLNRSHDRPLGEHGDPHAGDPITFF